jgi:hypothetical protein
MEHSLERKSYILRLFNDRSLNHNVILINESLMHILNSKERIKELLISCLEKCVIQDFNGGFRRFKLEGWFGGESNPTLEIVEIDEDKFKFGITVYGSLKPLSPKELEKPQIRKIITDFLKNPEKYLLKNG